MKKSRSRIVICCLVVLMLVGVAIALAACLSDNTVADAAETAANPAAEANGAIALTTGIVCGVVSLALVALFAVFSGNSSFLAVCKKMVIGIVVLMVPSSTLAVIDTYYDMAPDFYETYRGVTDIGGVACANTNFVYDFAYPTEKIFKTDDMGKDASYALALAQNEYEGFQITVACKKDGEIKLEMSDYVSAGGAKLKTSVYKEYYLAVKGENYGSTYSNEYPDALIPYVGEAVELEKNYAQTFYIEARSESAESADLRGSEATPAGDYTATLKLIEGDVVILNKTLTAHVYDFELPVTPVMDTAIGIFGGTYGDYGKYYNTLLERNISPYNLPYDILDERADAYMNDPRVTSFTIPFSWTPSVIKAYYKKVNENPVWREKGYFYPIDEPDSASDIVAYNRITDYLEENCPGYHMVTPYYGIEVDDKENEGETINNFDVQAGRSDISCPETVCFDSEEFYTKTMERVSNGDKSWWYVCCGPRAEKGYCNMFIHQQGIKHRILFWQQYDYDVTGFLYWSVAYWARCGDPWQSSLTWDDYSSAGDGS